MRPLRILAALALPAALGAGCSERTPTGPTGLAAGAASAASAGTSARSSPRPLAARATQSQEPIGTWGGNSTNLTIGVKSAVIEFDCAHGTIDQPFVSDSFGRFDLAGTFEPEGPGPVRLDPPPARPARYSGSTNGATMILTVTLTDTGETLGPYVLTFGAAGRLFKCL
ncbi:MAG TPA: hypothetical protein VKG01_17665 [Thermoanaerobaculia bacterium]|nr:hypothetical protein [Thermoanaerobaculia bacterium]